ncbi:hypothetical protein D5F01_LYC23932 [Larimichthys crocea]|uniref:Uncharacterized protein n=1 Tax=Larimichthys crocea TaxID=215358 RepID=A0A6G0HFI6_LARCR|nr:hypothetical protein D5F01_LYC23932 [Larimichthys crocea]
MTSQKSICFALNQQAVTVGQALWRSNSRPVVLKNNEDYGDEDVLASGFNGHRGQWNNLALGNLTFKHVPSQLIASIAKRSPQIGDVCVRVMPVIHQSEEFSSIVASKSGAVYHTGDVDSTTVPGEDTTRAMKLYLLAKSVPSRGNDVTVLGDEAGATLGLIWVAHEEELHDHLRNSQDCYYLHIGTKAGNSFRCNGFCEWRYYNHRLFNRMAIIGQETVSMFDSSVLAGNTGDSARILNET